MDAAQRDVRAECAEARAEVARAEARAAAAERAADAATARADALEDDVDDLQATLAKEETLRLAAEERHCASALLLLAKHERGGGDADAYGNEDDSSQVSEKQKEKSGTLDHETMLEEAVAVVAPFDVVDGLQACSPEVEYEDGRAAERSDSITAPVASKHTSTTEEEPSARELTLTCENSDLRSQLDELRQTHDALIALMKKERLDRATERDALESRCDTLVQKCDDASAEAESERTRARDIEAACDRAFDELKRQASQIAACSDWRGLTTDASAGAGAGGAGGDDDAEKAALANVRKAKARLRRLQGLIGGGEDFHGELGQAHGRLAEVKAEFDFICDAASRPLADKD